ncbi:hypothetical protein QBZ16_005050 [Prototheca wickerhamii]|uniref:Hpc2-related domain-containing protein n=1 Tax=Prototheca wickerhamii TaxID=3111 RepID=A0AAD9IGR2_PROWI|nr:hypothetical protein QBZ16_005050 [Prototheca wickerhamii]
MVEPKPRKRIVPIQITASSPTLPSPPPKSVDLAVEQRGPSISSLKAQAEAAEKGLGLGRKMFVPLAGLDPSKPMVDWKEATGSSDSEFGGSDGESSSDNEEETEPVTDGGNVTGTDGEERRKKHRHNDDYDHMDEFIDDSEFIELFEDSDRRQTKFQGFFITRGEIERVEEDAAPVEKKRRRKAGGDAPPSPSKAKEKKKKKIPSPSKVEGKSDAGKGGAEAGTASVLRPANGDDGASPKKKKKKKDAAAKKLPGTAAAEKPADPLPALAPAAPSLAQLAAQAGAGVAQGLAPAPGPSTAAEAPAPSQPASGGDADRGEPRPATAPPAPEAPSSEINASLAELRDFLAGVLQPAPPLPAEATAEEREQAEASAWKAVPTQVRGRIFATLRQALEGAGVELASPKGREILHQTHAVFPANTVSLAGVRKIYAAERKKVTRTSRAAAGSASAAGSEPASQEAPSVVGAPIVALSTQGESLAPAMQAALATEQAPPATPVRAASTTTAAAEPPVAGPGASVLNSLAAVPMIAPIPVAAMPSAPAPQSQAPPTAPTVPSQPAQETANNNAPPKSASGDSAGSTVSLETKEPEQPHASQATSPLRAPGGGPVPAPGGGYVSAPAPSLGAPQSSPPQAASPSPSRPDPEAGLQPTMTDETILAAVLERHGGAVSAPDLQAALTSTKGAVTRALALAGPSGASTGECAEVAVQLGLLGAARIAPDSRANTLSALTRATHKPHVAHIGGYKYALKAFHGVQDLPRRQAKTSAGESGGKGEATPGPQGNPLEAVMS